MFNLATIFIAQSMMGTVLLKKANRILKVPRSVPARVFLYVTLVISIPFLPCVLLLQVSSIATQESKLILGWEKHSNSPTSIARVLFNSRKKRQFLTETYAQIQLLEGVFESLPQIVLLLAYYWVSFNNPNYLSIFAYFLLFVSLSFSLYFSISVFYIYDCLSLSLSVSEDLQ